MVSRRIAAALGLGLLLAQGRPVRSGTTTRLFAAKTIHYGHGESEARRFHRRTDPASRRRSPKYIIPAYEDAWYYMWRERRFPSTWIRSSRVWKTRRSATASRKVFNQGLNKVAGYVLPLRRVAQANGPGWMSGSWFLRAQHLFFCPAIRLWACVCRWIRCLGAAVGLSLRSYPTRSRCRRCGPLPPPRQAQRQSRRQFASALRPGCRAPPTNPPPEPANPPIGLSAPPLCVEPREGRLFVFMPPVATTEDYLDLVSAVEETAASSNCRSSSKAARRRTIRG